MLEISGTRYGSCEGLARRSFLRLGALGLGGLTLPDLLRARAGASGQSSNDRAVIQILLSGGPSHLETYDPKPEAPLEYRTEIRATPTKIPGVRLGELMPGQARVMDRLAIIRSLSHETSDHVAGLHWIMTGYASTQQQQARNERPSVGSIVARLRGANGSGVPPYCSMTSGAAFGGLFQGGAYLGPGTNPFRLDVGPSGDLAGGNLQSPRGLTLDRLEDRKSLLARLDTIDRRRDLSGEMDGLDQFTAQAYEMVTGPAARQALDLSHEDPRIRDRYGRSRVGQSCLLARRLVEAGVTFVTIAEGNWDHHASVAQNCRKQVPAFDLAVSSLVEDLHDRGLSDRVLVVVWGEFGRTPRLNGSGGRDHWPGSMSAMVSGGGLRMGQVVGATDRKGEQPTERPLRPEDLIQTVYHVLGIDPHHEFPNESGRPMAVMDRGRPIAELIGS
ncbi:DUF1501 domain-containing protein [Tundrisphaera lichenicola]|uniref:DUF1501 domain-containing protein n=1 Tax=Tundrisphaera lichenicola TaxID=2029860 RepID=UPI003EBB21D8